MAGTGGTLATQASGVSGTATGAVAKLLNNPMFKVSFAQTLGNDYDKAKRAGANDMDALLAATICSLMNATMDVSGGIETLPKELKEALPIETSRMKQLAETALWDAKENIFQDTISKSIDKTVLGKNIPFFSWEDENAVVNPGRMAKDFAANAATSAALGGIQIVTDGIIRKLNEIDLSNATTNNVKEVRDLENATEEQILAYVQKSYLAQNDCQFMKICEVTPELAQKLEAVGIYVEGGNHALRDNDLRHVRKRHGDLSNDKYKVAIDDYANLQNVIEHYDELYLGYLTKDGNFTIVYEKTIDQKVFYVEEVLEDGVLSTKQMLKVGKKSKPSFMKKYTKITDVVPDTDVPPEAEPTGLISPPSNHVQDAGAYVGYGDSVLQPVGNVKGKDIDLSKLDATTREKVLALQEAHEQHYREADREEQDRLFLQGFETAYGEDGTAQSRTDADRLTDAYNEYHFERYKEVLKENAPQTLEEFSKIRYDNGEAWEQLKRHFEIVERYEMRGTVPVDQVIELDQVAYRNKKDAFDYSAFHGKNRDKVKALATGGNAAAMELDGKVYFSHSAAKKEGTLEFDAYGGEYPLIGLSDERIFTTFGLGDGIPREYDTEAKFLEYVARLKKDTTEAFTVTILSEKHICRSCEGVVEQFRKRYPNATVNIISGNPNYGEANARGEWGLKTWKHRKD